MVSKRKWIRLLSAALAVVTILSVVSVAGAVPNDVIDAKDEIAAVDIIQTYNDRAVDGATHNYHNMGDEVTIDYEASLYMTEEMAVYLQARQTQLKNAKFNVHINMDMDRLEFIDKESDTVSVIFKSTFLKPWENIDAYDVKYPDAFADFEDYETSAYTVEFLGRDEEGFFSYQVTVDKAWALSKNSFDITMELISCYDGQMAYSYEDVLAHPDYQTLKYEPLMYEDFTIACWMKPITLSIAEMRVKDEVRESVTYDPSTWVYIKACGTVDGEFTYVPGPCGQIESLSKWGSETTLEFGNDSTIEEWVSNEVYVHLIRTVEEEPPYLNLEDHFAYVIGYPDGNVKPEGSITRAEVATIFFRMLTDKVRTEFWCQTNDFDDVKLNDWYNNAISTLANLNILDGYPDGTFRPDAKITRGEFAAIAVRFFENTDDLDLTAKIFTDIDGHWAHDEVMIAHLLKIVNGYPDGTYKPDNDITRAEAMTIVNNTLRRSPCIEGMESMEDEENYNAWPDNADKTKWYYAAVQEATNSHDYSYFAEPAELTEYECWTKILPVRDWAAFERAWSDSNSAANPGDVVDSH